MLVTDHAPELLNKVYEPVWNPVAVRAPESGKSIARVLVVGREEDTAPLIRQLTASRLFAATCFEQSSVSSSGFDHVLLIAPAHGSPDLETSLATGAQALFALIKDMMLHNKSARLVHLVPGERQGYRPEYQGLSGFYKTLRIERPSYVGRVVHYERAALAGEALAQLVAAEFQDSDRSTDVCYLDGVRLVRQFRRPQPREGIPAFREGGVYLITGGLGAIGRIVARHLSEKYRATVYLTGRSALTESGDQELSAITALGGQAQYLVCDVASREQVRSAIASIRKAGHRLNGVLHSAGVIEDNFILKKTLESFSRVIAPKTLGTWNLDEETLEEPLDCFVLFSSVTGVLGNLGQSDYGFANSFEDYFAHARQVRVNQGTRHGRTLSINWPLWKEGGMRLSDKEEATIRRQFGLVPLLSATGLEALEYGLEQQLTQMLVMPGDTAKIAEVLGVVAGPASTGEATAAGATRGTDDLIAIVGLSGRYPHAQTLEEFWENLKIGRDCIVEIPSERWDAATHFQAGRPVLGKSYSKWGGFIQDVDQFDPLFFSISRKEAEQMDPNERLFLETAALTIEDAGYTPDTITTSEAMKDSPVGVYVGVMWADYQLHGVDAGTGTVATPHAFHWSIANRVSYCFNFSGPSITVDTACSASLTAIHLACAAIQRGEIGAAIAGGVNLALHPHKYNLTADMHMFSTDGRCHSFGNGGDGYVPGEGVGAVLLKPLAKARAAGDHIYAVIRGSALNHGGKTSGFSVPNPKRQAALIQEALRNAAVNPRHINYLEAHGTGTSLGDPIEMTGLTTAFAHSEAQYCPIGSVKANIGHLEAAAGIAGLTKVLLQMKHRALVPSIHSDALNRYIDWQRSPFYVQHSFEEWRRPNIDDVEILRLAGISSFGAGGSNAHLIVEEYVEEPTRPASAGSVLIVLSAKKAVSLTATATKLADYLESNPEVSLADVAYTLQVGRVALDLRLAIVVDRVSDAIDCLRRFARGDLDSAPVSDVFTGARGDWKSAVDASTEEWVASRDLPRIATAWVGGLTVDWQRLHERGARRRLSLPGYSFNRQQYWISKPNVAGADVSAGAGAASSLHPLVDANVSTLEEQTFRKTFRPDEFFLRDHRLGDNRIVPAVAHLELVIQASHLASTSRRVAALRDVSWMKPIIANENSTTIHVGLIPEREAVRFEIYEETGEQRQLYSQGLVELVPADRAVGPESVAGPGAWPESSVDVNAIRSRCQSMDREAIAATFAQLDFTFGPTFQVFEVLHFNKDEALARLRSSQQSEAQLESYLLHPALLDGALRTALGIDGFSATVRGMQVPVGLRRLSILQPPSGGDFFAYVKRSQVAPARADQCCYDILLLDLAGKVLVRIEELATQIAPQLALSRKSTANANTPAPAVVTEKVKNENLSKEALQAAVSRHLVDLVSAVTKLAADEIDPKRPLGDYGIDSVMILSLNESLERTFGEISKTLFFEYLEIHSLAEYFADNYAQRAHTLIAPSPVTDSTAASPVRREPAEEGPPHPLQELLFTSLKATLGAAAQECSRSTPLAEWPLDPVNECKLLFRLQSEVAGLSRSALYRFQTLSDWAASLRPKPQAPENVQVRVSEKPRHNRFASTSVAAGAWDIAIIGLTGRYPGANDLDTFWANLSAGKDCITEVPRSRWDFRRYNQSGRNGKRPVEGRWGGFIDGVDQFDPHFFNISVREAELLDPQERLFLQTAWECLEDAAYTRATLKNVAVGVFVGVTWGHYELIDVTDEQLQYGRAANLFASIANRVSYFLNLSGPSMALDTMCSSSLTAIHTACQSIRNGDCQLALAGGVNLMVHPRKYQFLAQGQFLSTDGRCRAFGEGGDGYVPGEGVGAVLLKPLERALEDGDHIYGVIKASALNHGGKTNGFTVPNQNAQTNLVSAALQRAGWDPGTIDYIEAHGTGTSLGDPIEIAGLSKAFGYGAATGTSAQCRIGSVKSNIGHLESAAGVAGLTKVLLQLKHRRIAPSLHSTQLNPHIDFSRSLFRVVQELEDWESPGSRGGARRLRRAGISSFGAGGSNAHLLIEEHAHAEEVTTTLQRPVIFVLSANSEGQLTSYVERMLEFLRIPADLKRLAFSSQVGREAMEERVAVVASSVAELVTALTQFRNGVIVSNVHRGRVRKQAQRLDTLLDEDQRQSLIDSMVRGGRLEQLAKAWVSFLDVDWSRYATALFGATPRKTPFPTIPFITERYWVQEEDSATTPAHAALHPFLDKNISTLSQQQYFKQFSGEEFYLRDHIVVTGAERVIFPGVAYLEMARAAGELALGDEWSVHRIRNLIWIRPLEIRQTPEQVLLSLTQSDNVVEVEVACASTQDAYMQGELLYRPKGESDADEWLDLAALRAAGVAEEDKAAIYASYRQMGFLYGSSYQVTEARYRGPKGTLSRLRLPAHLRSGVAEFALHPSLLDAAARSCLAVEMESSHLPAAPLVPFALGDLEIRHPLTEECYAYATPADADTLGVGQQATAIAGAELRKYNVVVTDSSGRVLVKLLDFAARSLVRADPTPARRLQYFRYDWLEAPAATSVSLLPDARETVLVISKESSLATALADRWGARVGVVHAQPGASYAALDTARFQFDASSDAGYRQLISTLRERALLPNRIVCCLDQAEIPGVHAIRSLFLALEAVSPGQSVRCAVLLEEPISPHDQAISALGKSVLTINHRFELLTVQSDASDPARIAIAVENELYAGGNPTGHEIAYRGDSRYRRRLLSHEPRQHAASGELLPLPLRPRGVYLITGGVGKLGLVLARYLATRWGARLILSGRSTELNESQTAALHELRQAGAEAHYCAADIANATEAGALVQFAKAQCGEINGIIHCAGVASGTPLTQSDRIGFAGVLAPKIDGLINLDRLTEKEPLAFFAAFSSVSAVLGDPGAGAYAVGNRFMDSYVLWREKLRAQGRRYGRSVSINWPLWATGGMGLPEEEASLFQLSGMSALTEEEGIVAFESILRGELPQVLVATGDVEKITRTLQVYSATDLPRTVKAPPAPVRPTEHSTKPHDIVRQFTEQWVKERLAVVVKTKASSIDSQRTFEECGMDSVMMMELLDNLSKELGTLPKTVLFEHDTPARLANYLLLHRADELRRRVGDPSRLEAPAFAQPRTEVPQQQLAVRPSLGKRTVQPPVPESTEDGVAIIGIAGQFPKAADLCEFWSNIQSARDCLTEIPAERWDTQSAGAQDWRGGFLPDIDRFDPALFRMTVSEAQKTDPQVRVLLRTAWQALEDSAYTPDGMGSQRVGVYVGAMNEDFTWIMSDAYARTGEYQGPGAIASDLANRISFLMNFRGPSLTVGTACSSSLTAVHLARRAILDNECDMALAGAVNLSLHPSKYFMLRDMKVLSPDGQERTFDETAKGFVPSEGVGVIVLKRLSQARKDGDQIYAVIRSSCLSHSGTGAGQFLPNIRVMEETVARSIRESGLTADQLTYIESHGTGTELGDPIELKALANAMRQFTSATQFCAIGTRANLGHMEAASGVSALIKVLLAMKHRQLSPCAKLESVNTSFEHEISPFFFPRQAQPWPASPGQPLVAGINSFGMGGSNGFMIVESLVPETVVPRVPAVEPSIVVLSARSPERLRAHLSTTLEFLERADQEIPAENFADFAYSSQVGRVPFQHRLAIVATGKQDFIAKAREYLTTQDVPEVFVGNTSSTDALASVLTGEEAHEFIAALIKSRQWHKIASIWASGGTIDWVQLHAGIARRRLSFPSCPFESIRCDVRAASTPGIEPARRGRQRAVATRGLPGDHDARDVKIEWFDLAPSTLGDTLLPADLTDLDSGDDRAKQYWLDHLGETVVTGGSVAPLLAVQSGSETATGVIESVSEVLEGTLIESLQRCTQIHQIEPETLLVAAWALLVNRYTKVRHSQFGVSRALIPIQTPEAPALLTEHPSKLLPVRICTVVREKVSQWLVELQRSLNRKHLYGHIPLQQIEGWVGAENLFDSVIVFQRTGRPWGGASNDVDHSRREQLAAQMFASHTALTIDLTVTTHLDAMELDILYRSNGPAPEKVAKVLEHFKVLLEGLIANPERNPAAVQMRTKTESRETFWKALDRVNR